jgi:peroxiredoxin
MKKFLFITLWVSCLVTGCALLELTSSTQSDLSTSSATQTTPALSAVVASVNGVALTRADLNKRMALVQLATWLNTGGSMNDLEEDSIVTQWIDAEVMAQAAAKANVTASEDEAQQEIARLLNWAKLDETDLLRQLNVVGVAREDLVRYQQRALAIQKFTNQHILADVSSETEKLSKLSTWLTVARASAKIEKPNQQTGPKTTGVYAGAIAPDFRLTALDGKELSLHAQRGKAVVINFWATWCGPCRSEMPALQKTAEEYAEQGMLLWGVDVGEPPDVVQSFVNELGLTFPILLDRDSKVSRQYRVFGLPTTIFVKRDGVISDVAIGAMDKATLDKYVTRVMK